MIVEPMAGDRVEDNLNPVGRAYYGFSTLLCTPASLVAGRRARARHAGRAGADPRRRRPRPGSPGSAGWPRRRSTRSSRSGRDGRGAPARRRPPRAARARAGARPLPRRRRASSSATACGSRTRSTAPGTARPSCCMPTWSIVPSRFWKAQVALPGPALPGGHLRRPGSGALGPAGRRGGVHRRASTPRTRSPSWTPPAPSARCWWRCRAARLVGARRGRAPRPGARHRRHRARRAACPIASPSRGPVPWDEPLDTAEGWAKYNRHYWLDGGYDDFLEFFFAQMFREPHSTKQIEDCVGWGARDRRPQTLADTTAGRLGCDGAVCRSMAPLCAQVRCPVLVVHGTDDRIRPHAIGERLAELTGGSLVAARGLPATGRTPATRCGSTS